MPKFVRVATLVRTLSLVEIESVDFLDSAQGAMNEHICESGAALHDLGEVRPIVSVLDVYGRRWLLCNDCAKSIQDGVGMQRLDITPEYVKKFNAPAELFLQWFNSLLDTHPDFLGEMDFETAEALHIMLGRSVSGAFKRARGVAKSKT